MGESDAAGIRGTDVDDPLRNDTVITFVTGNKKKLAEVTAIMATELERAGLPLRFVSLDIDLDELQSDQPEKIAAAKCRLAARAVGGPVLVDDTSLCFRALGGLPGPYIKWFQGELGAVGLQRMLHGFDSRAAWALCSVAFSPGPGAEPCVFTGRCDGYVLADDARGAGGIGESADGAGLGWDAIFVPDDMYCDTDEQEYCEVDDRDGGRGPPVGKSARDGGGDRGAGGVMAGGRTFAEMRPEEKNAISHRARALRPLARFLAENHAWVEGRAAVRRAPPRPVGGITSFRRRRRMV